ncbi:MAG: ABC transporter ATP-binding protein [bacterium]|nr:ABC transporter ATP-binding protein [bacterium]
MQEQERKKKGLLGFGILTPYFRLLKNQRADFALVIFLMLISTSISLAIPIFAGRFVDAISNTSMGQLSSHQLLILGALLVAQLLGTFFFKTTSARLGLRTITLLRGQLFSHLLELPSLYFTDQKAGDLSSRATSDVGSIQYILTSGLVTFLRAVLTLVGALILMVNLNPQLTTVILLLIPTTIGLVRLFGWRLQKLHRRMYDELGRISSQVQETVGGIRSLKVYNAQNHENRRFGEMNEKYLNAGLKRAWVQAALESGIQISLWICLLVVVVYGFTLTAQGQTSGGQLVAFLLLAIRVAMPLSSLTTLFSSAQGAVAAAGRLDDIFAQKTERQPGLISPRPDSRPVSLELKDVSFTYPGTQSSGPILNNLNLKISPGQRVGIVGPSGVGKTTLAGMLLGLLPASTGVMSLDDKSYDQYDISDLRSRMAWVSQDPVLYDESLRQNILFGLNDVSDEQLSKASEMAGVSGFAESFPQGMETRCGERGNRLSGGQRQRVSLARAFLRNPGLLVLDEPTSALDAESEESIRLAMKELMAGRTTIVIAHRLSLVRDMDLILVLTHGKITESGNHDELMSQSGLYTHLYNLQKGS